MTNETINLERTVLNSRQLAIFSKVWKLEAHEIPLLSAYFLLQATGEELDAALQDQKDEFCPLMIKHANYVLNTHFLRPRGIAEAIKKNDTFLISCRINIYNNFYYALVRELYPNEKVRMETSDLKRLE